MDDPRILLSYCPFVRALNSLFILQRALQTMQIILLLTEFTTVMLMFGVFVSVSSKTNSKCCLNVFKRTTNKGKKHWVTARFKLCQYVSLFKLPNADAVNMIAYEGSQRIKEDCFLKCFT